MNDIRFPDVHVTLAGEDGNAFSILGRVSKALRQGGATTQEVAEFTSEATAGDFDMLLQTVACWVEVS